MECIQRNINNVVHCFAPKKKDDGEIDDKYRLMDWAKQVYDFLFENRVISMMSILGDMQDYHPTCNSVNTQRGFALALAGFVDDKQKRMLVFSLTSIMQVAFLSGEHSKGIIGYDLYRKEERDLFIDIVVEMLFSGIVDKEK